MHYSVFERGREAISGHIFCPKLPHTHVQIQCNANEKSQLRKGQSFYTLITPPPTPPPQVRARCVGFCVSAPKLMTTIVNLLPNASKQAHSFVSVSGRGKPLHEKKKKTRSFALVFDTFDFAGSLDTHLREGRNRSRSFHCLLLSSLDKFSCKFSRFATVAKVCFDVVVNLEIREDLREYLNSLSKGLNIIRHC